jgi:energy-coupling factor transport system substrate-specific component
VTWQAAAFALLAVAVAGGFAWYERANPSARVLALVATMAALAALGRIAFAPIPNVKPTTDLVLISGAALGGAPGFAVGALAALTSNLFFGQGPWTPWQMAAWGGVGLAGAALARVTRGRPGRLTLAAACGMAGLAFGAVMNLQTLTFLGHHSLSELGVVYAAALPFDIAHAAGNVVFAAAFGPALLRALQRFRVRFEVTWRPASATVAALAALAGAVALAAPAGAATPASYLLGAQNADGGWGAARGQGSSQLYTGWASLGLAASGRNPLDLRRRGRSPIDYMRARSGQLNDTGELERTILVLAAAGADPRRFGGRNLVAELERRRHRDGAYGGGVVLTSFAVMALKAAGRGASAGVRSSVRWLERQQNRDGGFSVFGRGGHSGVDDTASAVQGLAAGGRRGSRAVVRAMAFLARSQNPDGGFPLHQGDGSNAQSTSYAIQAAVAAGRNPDRLRRGGSRSAPAYLRSLVGPGGSVRYSRTSAQTPVWVTGQALAALSRRAFPIGRVRRARGAGAAGAVAGGAAGGHAAARGGGAGGSLMVPLAVLAAAHRLGLATGWLMAPVTR